ncbi:MAG: Ig-like domain-containing protein [Thermoanaerobaculia bacterium]
MPPLRSLVALALVPLTLLACASARTTGATPIAGDLGGVRVRVFADDDARRDGALLPGAIGGALERREKGRWLPVFRSLDPTWTVAGLVPGSYRVRFASRLSDDGREQPLPRAVTEAVTVRAGQMSEVEVILDHVSPAMVAAGAAAVVVAAVLLHHWLDDLDLPRPPLPPHWLVDTVFYVTLDLSTEVPTWHPVERAPRVTSHFPRQGDVVVTRRLRVVFALSEPAVGELGPDAIVVRTADGRVVPGRVAYERSQWWVVWEPEEDLPRGETLTATLAAGAVTDDSGEPLRRESTVTFRTAR